MAEDKSIGEKFSVEGERMIYDTRTTGREIEDGDIEGLLDALRTHPDVTTLVLDSSGGSVWVSLEMARVAMDFEIDTEVRGECSSSCVNLFLAGQKRTMMRGAQIGIHQWSWSPSAMQTYYESWKDTENWDTPFEFGSWAYYDAQTETYNNLKYFISRGVSAEFAIEMKAPHQHMWFPTRAELLEAGVLTE